ncbi:MAG TPA: DUF2911 domain-containing protein [Chitinophagaceae bacterium]|jgi:hypothetical protein|nr:DUF2911 domain-containing protein [Chitinophagaceae bacterium]
MKPILFFVMFFLVLTACGQQDKSQRPSPPALAKQTLKNGTIVSIDYSQPAVKGRAIGKDLEPLPGKVWRTGANEATVFEVSKDVEVEGKKLPAGKYGLFTIANGDDWTIIFNKTWKQWGAFDYKDADDALRVNVKGGKAKEFAERMTFKISDEGKVRLLWGDKEVDFKVK